MQDKCPYDPVTSAAMFCVYSGPIVLVHLAIHSSFHGCRMIPRGSWEVILLRQKQLMVRNSLKENRFAKLEH